MREYKSVLDLTVPFVHKEPEWYATHDTDHICIHCKENPTVKTELRLVPWCTRCYILMGTKHDGTTVKQTTRGIAQDLEDLRKGKVEVKSEVAQVREIVVES